MSILSHMCTQYAMRFDLSTSLRSVLVNMFPLQVKSIHRKIDYTTKLRVKEKKNNNNQKTSKNLRTLSITIGFYCSFPGFSSFFHQLALYTIYVLCAIYFLRFFFFHSIFLSAKGSLYVPKGA